MSSFPLTLGRLDEEVLILVGMLAGMALIMFIVHSGRKAMETRSREQTKREIAAYVAEGSIKAEEAATLLEVGADEAEKMIADGVAWGTVKPEKAEKLIRTLRSERSKSSAVIIAQGGSQAQS